MLSLSFKFHRYKISIPDASYVDKVHHELILSVPDLPPVFRGMYCFRQSVVPFIRFEYVLNLDEPIFHNHTYWSIVEFHTVPEKKLLGINCDCILKNDNNPVYRGRLQNLTLRISSIVAAVENGLNMQAQS